MSNASYEQFCPLSMAAEITCTRWTPLVLRELLNGTRRFNDFRRGVPKMSPALLSKRLKELEHAGVVETRTSAQGITEYHPTEAGEALRPFIDALGMWGHVWVDSRVTLRKLDPSLLMWDIRRKIRPDPPFEPRRTIQFLYPELPQASRNWWLVVASREVELCYTDPGYDTDVLVSGSLRSVTAIWMGLARLADELSARRVSIDGPPALVRQVGGWLGQHPLNTVPRRAG